MQEGKGGISDHNLRIYTLINRKYKTKKKGKKLVYDCKTALKNEELVNKFYEYRPEALSDMLKKTEKLIEKGYIPITGPKNHPNGYKRAKDVFGNIQIFNNLCNRIRNLIEKGENFKNNSLYLQRKFRLKKEPAKDIWDWIHKDYEGMTKEELKQLRKTRKFFEDQQPLKEEECNNEIQGKELTKEEYKRRFGYYPDLGKK